MDKPVLKTPLEKFYEWEKNHSQRIFLRQPTGELWTDYTWGEVARQVRRMAQVLIDLGCKEGDRVAIVSKNCAHWIIADLQLVA